MQHLDDLAGVNAILSMSGITVKQSASIDFLTVARQPRLTSCTSIVARPCMDMDGNPTIGVRAHGHYLQASILISVFRVV